MTAPASAPPPRAAVRLVTGPVMAVATAPPAMKPTNVGSQRNQSPRAVEGSKSELAAGERVDMDHSPGSGGASGRLHRLVLMVRAGGPREEAGQRGARTPQCVSNAANGTHGISGIQG